MEESSHLFGSVVETIFNGWTALRLAVEHGMGGYQSKEVAVQFVNQVTELLYKNNGVGVEEVADFLIDYMDSEFHTLCEDNSPDEVASVLWNFFQLFKTGDRGRLDTELSKLPKCDIWLCKPINSESSEKNVAVECASASGLENNRPNTVMKEDCDPEWTEVKSRRKKERIVM